VDWPVLSKGLSEEVSSSGSVSVAMGHLYIF
jgi:hypothetical protein